MLSSLMATRRPTPALAIAGKVNTPFPMVDRRSLLIHYTEYTLDFVCFPTQLERSTAYD